MSHLSVLPTLINDLTLLAQALNEEGFHTTAPGSIRDFHGRKLTFDLVACESSNRSLAWKHCGDGSLSLIADLHRLTKDSNVPEIIHNINRR